MFPVSTETHQVAGNRTRKSAQRNVRSKRPTTSSHEELAHGDVEPIKSEQRLVPSRDSRNSSSCQLTSEKTSASASTGASDPHLKDTTSRNTDSAVITNNDTETKPSNSDSRSAVLTDNLADTSIDLDEQAILTYVFLQLILQHFSYVKLPCVICFL